MVSYQLSVVKGVTTLINMLVIVSSILELPYSSEGMMSLTKI